MADTEGRLEEATVSDKSSSPESNWAGLRSFAVDLALDTLKNLCILAALAIIFLTAKGLGKLGMEEADLHRIERLHFWLNYAALVWIGIVFLIKLIRRGI